MEIISFIFFIIALLFAWAVFLVPLIAIPGLAEIMLFYFIKTGTFNSVFILGSKQWTDAVMLSLAIAATFIHVLWIYSKIPTKKGTVL